jgi:hypothetical protein
MKAGTATPRTKVLRARGVSPDGQRSDVDNVGRADQHGVLGSPAYRDGDRWNPGLLGRQRKRSYGARLGLLPRGQRIGLGGRPGGGVDITMRSATLRPAKRCHRPSISYPNDRAVERPYQRICRHTSLAAGGGVGDHTSAPVLFFYSEEPRHARAAIAHHPDDWPVDAGVDYRHSRDARSRRRRGRSAGSPPGSYRTGPASAKASDRTISEPRRSRAARSRSTVAP